MTRLIMGAVFLLCLAGVQYGRCSAFIKGVDVTEWRGFYDRVDPDLIHGFYQFRSLVEFAGGRVVISPAKGAILRDSGTSQHVKGKAVDVFIVGISLKAAFNLANECRSFSGLGVYPHWVGVSNTVGGLHLDTRANHTPSNPSLWGGINITGEQELVSLLEIWGTYA